MELEFVCPNRKLAGEVADALRDHDIGKMIEDQIGTWLTSKETKGYPNSLKRAGLDGYPLSRLTGNHRVKTELSAEALLEICEGKAKKYGGFSPMRVAEILANDILTKILRKDRPFPLNLDNRKIGEERGTPKPLSIKELRWRTPDNFWEYVKDLNYDDDFQYILKDPVLTSMFMRVLDGAQERMRKVIYESTSKPLPDMDPLEAANVVGYYPTGTPKEAAGIAKKLSEKGHEPVVKAAGDMTRGRIDLPDHSDWARVMESLAKYLKPENRLKPGTKLETNPQWDEAHEGLAGKPGVSSTGEWGPGLRIDKTSTQLVEDMRDDNMRGWPKLYQDETWFQRIMWHYRGRFNVKGLQDEKTGVKYELQIGGQNVSTFWDDVKLKTGATMMNEETNLLEDCELTTHDVGYKGADRIAQLLILGKCGKKAKLDYSRFADPKQAEEKDTDDVIALYTDWANAYERVLDWLVHSWAYGDEATKNKDKKAQIVRCEAENLSQLTLGFFDHPFVQEIVGVYADELLEPKVLKCLPGYVPAKTKVTTT